ncbi:MAG: alpha/beta fold hydrolase [Planctomycetota bacterium]
MNDPTDSIQLVERRLFLDDADEPGRRVGLRVESFDDQAAAAPAAAPRPVAVLVHGFKGFMDWAFFPYLSLRFAAAGFVTVSMNCSGSGIGDDPMELDDEEAFFRDTITRQLEDVERARAYARRLPGVDAEREVLFGHSRGGGVALLSASALPPAAVVTWSAVDDLDRFSEAEKEEWRRDGVLLVPNARTGQIHRMGVQGLDDMEANRERYDVLAAASRVQAPILAVHGTHDPVVDPGAASRIADRAPRGEALLVDGANHGLGATHPLTQPHEIRTLQSAIEGTIGFALQHTAR